VFFDPSLKFGDRDKPALAESDDPNMRLDVILEIAKRYRQHFRRFFA